MFSNFKISTRLTVGFSFILLFLVIVGSTGYWGMQKMASEITALSDKGDKLVEYAQRARANINMMRRYEKDMFMNIGDPAKTEEYKKEWEASLDHFRQRTDAITRLLDSQNDKDSVVMINKLISTYADGFVKIYENIKSSEIKTTQEANKAIGIYKDATHQSESKVIDFAKKMDKLSDVQVNEAIFLSNKLQMSMLILSVVAVFLALFLAISLTRSITIPINKAAALVAIMAQGDFTTRLDIDQKDEIGLMTKSLNRMTVQLGSMIKDIVSNANSLTSS